MRSAILLMALTGCVGERACIDAPPSIPRSGCERARVEVVIHISDDPLMPADADTKVVDHIEDAIRLVAPHGIELAIVGLESESYWPHLHASVPGCDAFRRWGESAPDDGRLHVYPMLTIEGVDVQYGGLNKGRAIAIKPNAKPKIGAHEVGHALGLHHADNPRDLMWPGDLYDAHEFSAEQGASMLAFACDHFGEEEGPRRG